MLGRYATNIAMSCNAYITPLTAVVAQHFLTLRKAPRPKSVIAYIHDKHFPALCNTILHSAPNTLQGRYRALGRYTILLQQAEIHITLSIVVALCHRAVE